MTKLHKRKQFIAAALSSSAIVIYLIYRVFGGAPSDSDAVQYYEVKRSNLHVSVIESGSLQAVKQVAVKNLLSGNSKIIYIIPEGSEAEKGELLVELDASEMKEQKKMLEIEILADESELATASNNLIIEQSTVDSEVRAAQKDITFAKMDLEKFENLDKQQQLRNAESDISQTLDAFKLAEQRYEWSKKLVSKGFETKSQADRDRLDVNSKNKALETSKSKRKMLELYDIPKQEAELNSILSEAEKKYTRVIKQGESKISRSKAALTSKEDKFKLNKERLTEVNERLLNSKLHAPVGGLVVYAKAGRGSREEPIEEGASVRQNKVLIYIPSNNQMKVKVSIPEFHINKIKLDQLAHVVIDSRPNRRFIAKVSKVAVLPESQSWMASGEKSYKIEVLIEDQLPDVKPSTSAKAEITINDLDNVITVPLQALKTEKGKLYCYKKTNGGHEKSEVEIGLMNHSFVEIKSGLNEGDKVLLTQPSD
jgi:HlyD family secretion protein